MSTSRKQRWQSLLGAGLTQAAREFLKLRRPHDAAQTVYFGTIDPPAAAMLAGAIHHQLAPLQLRGPTVRHDKPEVLMCRNEHDNSRHVRPASAQSPPSATAVQTSMAAATLMLCLSGPPNTGDKLRSGARVHPGRRGHEAAP